jgi:hypothetical protein
MTAHGIAAKVALTLLLLPVAFVLTLTLLWLGARAYEAVRREYNARLIGRSGGWKRK